MSPDRPSPPASSSRGDGAAEPRRRRAFLLTTIVYPLVGVAFGALPATSDLLRTTWRLTAWALCAAAFAAHLRSELRQPRSSPARAATRVGLAVASGAFLLAVWVVVHARWVGASHRQGPLAPWALVVFPLVTAVPAFIAARGIGAVLNRIGSGTGNQGESGAR